VQYVNVILGEVGHRRQLQTFFDIFNVVKWSEVYWYVATLCRESTLPLDYTNTFLISYFTGFTFCIVFSTWYHIYLTTVINILKLNQYI